jgi:hypothetical protein
LAQSPDAPADSGPLSNLKPVVMQADSFGESAGLLAIDPTQTGTPANPDATPKVVPLRHRGNLAKPQEITPQPDGALQTFSPARNTPNPTLSFDGINNIDGYIPPDTVGAIGPSNFVQAVNVRIRVFNRFTGTAQTSANPISSLFSSLPGTFCATTDDGDPMVVYDQFADRWVVSQFANASSSTGPFYMSIAVSKTSDPTGAWYAYCFRCPGTKFPDYPKISVWPDGYYMSCNQFNAAGTAYQGVGVYCFNRAKMLVGDPTANYVYFDLASNPGLFGFLPCSADGPPPPVGTPNYFASIEGTSLGNPANRLRVFQFHADFVTTNASTFTERPDSPISVAAFTAFSAGVPQPGTGMTLDNLGDRLMFRLQYRNFGSNESLVVNHTVVGPNNQAAVRYYQLRRPLPSGSFSMNEQATYAPDTQHRWMGSAAMNYRGDLAVGYSVSSGSTSPSIRYAARLATDPPNGLFQGEATLIAGGGSQTGGNRWGDYSAMTMDPTDDCTFWYTDEYYSTTSAVGWRTRIGSFSLPGCSPSPRATVQGQVLASLGGPAVTNAVVRTANGYFRVTGANGNYSLTLTPGTYDFTAFATGVGTNTVPGVVITNGEALTLNFLLTGAGGQPPTIASITPSSQTVTAGSGASFTVSASGATPLSYQWRHNGTNIAAATASVFSIAATTTNDAGGYSAVVTNAYGSATSQVATLNVVLPAPNITSIDPPSLTVLAGAPASFTVSATGAAPLSYQWRRNGANIANATASAFSIAATTTNDSAGYSAVVTNAYGRATSAVATLTVVQAGQLVAVGDNSFGQATVPGGVSLLAVAAGSWHNVGLRSDTKVMGWGNNSSRQSDAPTNVSGVVIVAAGGYHSLALKADGTVVAWGDNTSGQTTVPANLSHVIGIAAGASHSVALQLDGTVVAWGDNSFGQTNIPAGLGNVVAIAAGGNHTLALRPDGTVAAWGENTDAVGMYAGQCDVPWDLTNAVAIAAGDYHSLALRADGTVESWGDNSQAQCSVPPSLPWATAIAGGGSHTLTRVAAGNAAAWGSDWSGQCDLPAYTNVIQITAGSAHSLLLLGTPPARPQLVLPTWYGGRFSIAVQTYPGRNYTLEYKDALSAAAWTGIGTAAGNGAIQFLVDPAATNPWRFYRVRQH